MLDYTIKTALGETDTALGFIITPRQGIGHHTKVLAHNNIIQLISIPYHLFRNKVILGVWIVNSENDITIKMAKASAACNNLEKMEIKFS